MFALTFCGYYCSFSSLVGVFFFVVLGIMEARQNPFLGEHYHKKYVNHMHNKLCTMVMTCINHIKTIFIIICKSYALLISNK